MLRSKMLVPKLNAKGMINYNWRELLEETGYHAKEEVYTYNPSANILKQNIHVFREGLD
jgi:hypothetical protein